MAPDIAASVKARLLSCARERGEDFQLLLTRYGLERFLFRLGRSEAAGDFILKGAMLFSAWGDVPHRATRDIDLLGCGEPTAARLVDVFRRVCSIPFADDGLTFDPLTVRADAIRDVQEYGGFRVVLLGLLGSARVPIQVDVGFGNAVTPPPRQIEYPTILPLPAPRIRAYPPESVVAEKLQAMVVLGMANSRMKDLYDLLILARGLSFDGATLETAVRNTFERRQTPIPEVDPVALTDEFFADPAKVRQWQAFLSRLELPPDSAPLREVARELREFLMPLLTHVRSGKPAGTASWPPGGPWRGLEE